MLNFVQGTQETMEMVRTALDGNMGMLVNGWIRQEDEEIQQNLNQDLN
jgi:hypothetical protein